MVPKIVAERHTFRIHAYKGIGHIPKNLGNSSDPKKRILLANLPRLLKGYGRTFQAYPDNQRAAVILVCDLDDRIMTDFLMELDRVADDCNPRPDIYFCLAIEEGEAWLLGDIPAIKTAYPDAKDPVLRSYVNDSICGTWETLANALYPGGSKELISKGWQAVGSEKSNWAERICPRMDVENNASPSFLFFRDRMRSL